MKISLEGIRKNKENNQEELYELNVNEKDIACLYKDKYGVAIMTYGGRLYRVNSTLQNLEEVLAWHL